MDNLDKYLEKTGQSFQELMSGAMQYGPDFITDELVSQALEQNKKIVWTPKLIKGENLGQLNYKLEPI